MTYPLDDEFSFFSEINPYEISNFFTGIQCVESINTFKKSLEKDRFWLSEQKIIHRFVIFHFIEYDDFLMQFKSLFNCYLKAFPYSSPFEFLKTHFLTLCYYVNELTQPMLFLESYGEDDYFIYLAYEESNNSKTFFLVEKNSKYNKSQLLHHNEILLKNIKTHIDYYKYETNTEVKNKVNELLVFSSNDKNISIKTESKDKDNSSKNTNPHPRIFKSELGFRFFDRLRTNVKNPLADYSFIYRKMIQDGIIYETIGDSEFRHWLSSNYQIEIDKTKQLYLCTTPNKEKLYSTTKDFINIK